VIIHLMIKNKNVRTIPCQVGFIGPPLKEFTMM
jgi:hypothetical protein